MSTTEDSEERPGLFATLVLLALILDSIYIGSQMIPMFASLAHQMWAALDPVHAAAIRGLFESNFATAVVGSFAGALGGAYAAQRLLERAEKKRVLERQIQQATLAVSLGYTIFNTILALKTQLVAPTKASHAAALSFHMNGPTVDCPKAPPFDLGTFSPVEVPIDQLMRVVMTELAVMGRPLVMVPTLSHSLRELAETINLRNQVVRDFKAKFPGGVPAALLFGLPVGKIADKTYPNLLDSICVLTDTTLFFSFRVTHDLMRYARTTADEYQASFKKRRKVTSIDFESLDATLIPSARDFESWDKNFPQEPADPRPASAT